MEHAIDGDRNRSQLKIGETIIPFLILMTVPIPRDQTNLGSTPYKWRLSWGGYF